MVMMKNTSRIKMPQNRFADLSGHNEARISLTLFITMSTGAKQGNLTCC